MFSLWECKAEARGHKWFLHTYMGAYLGKGPYWQLITLCWLYFGVMFKYEIISWHVATGYVLQCFWSSRDSSTLCFNILRYLVLLQPYVQYRPLCPIYAKICQYPKITILLALIKRYVDKTKFICYFLESFYFHEISWRLLWYSWKENNCY